MKAYVLHEVGNLSYEEVEKPELKAGWALVRVKAAGICSSDIPRIYETGTYHFPTIPGHEFSGIVEEVYSENDKNMIGKRVGVFPLIPCKECEQCQNKQYEMCSNYDYVGSRRDGGFAEFVAVPLWNLIELPDSVSYIQAATMEPCAVAYHAVKRLNIKETDAVAIVGTGMIGFVAAQWAVAMGAKDVTIIGRSDAKEKFTSELKDIEYIASNKIAITKEYDKVIEAVGSNDTLNTSVSITKAGGSILLMGNPHGDMFLEKNIYWKILRKQLTVIGTWNSSYENNEKSDWTEVIQALADKKIVIEPLISHIFEQDKLEDALKIMHDQTEVYTKIMTKWNKD